MSPTRLVERQKRVVAELAQLVDQRAQAAQAVDDGFRAAERSTTADYEHSLAHAAAQLQADEGAAEQTLRTARQSLTTVWESSSKSIENECQRAVETLVKRINRGERHAHKAMDEMRWLARTVYEAGRKREAQKVAEVQQQLRGRMRAARAIESEAAAWLGRVGQRAVVDATVAAVPEDVAGDSLAERLAETADKAHNDLSKLRALRLPPFVHGPGLVWIFFALAALVAPAAGWLAGWRPIPWLVPTAVLAAAGGVALSLWLRAIARRQTAAIFQSLVETLRVTETLCKAALKQATGAHQRKRAELRHQRDAEFRLAAEKHAPTLAACRAQREVDLPKLTRNADEKLVALQREFDAQVRQAVDAAARQKRAARESYERLLAAANDDNERRIAENKARYARARQEGAQVWQADFSRLQAELTAIGQEVLERCPPLEHARGRRLASARHGSLGDSLRSGNARSARPGRAILAGRCCRRQAGWRSHFHVAGATRFSGRQLGLHPLARRRPPAGHRTDASRHAAAAHLSAAGKDALHDHRPSGLGPELRLVHAPGRS